MTDLKRTAFAGLLVVTMFLIASGQDTADSTAQKSSVAITAAAFGDHVRITAPPSVVQMQVEVFAASGDKIFDQEIKGGNVFNWQIRSEQRLPAGRYIFVVRVKSISGKLTQKLGAVEVSDQALSIALADSAPLSPQQAQAIGPVEENSSWTVLGSDENQTPTVIAHDGVDGQIVRGRGAFSFRIGDFFSGNDKEQMRLTEEGNLGIGTAKPKAKLDVVGTVRAREGFQFLNGSTMNLNDMGALTLTNADGSVVPNVAGTGTQNRIAKWIDNAGTLGDSLVGESNGSVVVGTPAQQGSIQILGTAVQDVFAGMGPDVTNGPAFNYGYAGSSFGRSAGFFNVRPDASAIAPNPSLRFMTVNQERMIVTNAGNVGIGTSNPAAKLDVVGNINTSTQYNIGGQRTLFSGAANVFVGTNAGQNTAGLGVVGNDFLGTSAGLTNVSGSFNTMVGTAADVGANNLTNATALGSRALVTQSDSLVLGSINGQNGATADTNVGIGITAPTAKLHVAGSSSAINAPIASLQSSGTQIPLAFKSGANEVARIRADNQGNLLLATVSGANKDIYFRAGTDDANTDMFIQSSSGNVGINTTAPVEKLEVSNGNILSSGSTGGRFIAANPNNQSARVFLDWFNDQPRIRYGGSGEGSTNGFIIQGPGDVTKLRIADDGLVSIGSVGDASNSLRVNGAIFGLMAGGPNTPLCGNLQNIASLYQIVLCSSSIRYKEDVRGFAPGLDLLRRLRPVSFRWKSNGQSDIGLIAEEVERVEPLLVTYNSKGTVEGVKYDRVGVVLLNAVQEQQAQIKAQEQQLRAKDERIANLSARLTRYESSLMRYESRLMSLERIAAANKRKKQRVTARSNSTHRSAG